MDLRGREGDRLVLILPVGAHHAVAVRFRNLLSNQRTARLGTDGQSTQPGVPLH